MKRQIDFSQEQIPEVHEPMQLLKLDAPIVARRDMIEAMVRKITPGAEVREGKSGAIAAYDGNRLVAYVHPETGQTNLFPLLERLKAGRGLAERAKEATERLGSDPTLFPKDVTRLIPLAPVTLLASTHSRDGERTKPAEILAFVRFERQVDGLPVFGPGTRATVAVGLDNTVHSFTHRWKSANPSGDKIRPHSREHITNAILEQLTVGSDDSDVKVDKVVLGYFDGGERYLQPVYRFHATITSHNKELHAANRHVFGYVSIGDAPEPLPKLGVQDGECPEESRPSERPASSNPVLDGDPTVGRYVVRNDSQGWVDSANGFFANLEAAGAIAGLFGRSPIPFSSSQYFWAEPRLFLSEKDAFVNSVQIALTEVHGNWGLFSTRDNHDDLVHLKDIPASGYGGGGGGALAFWILHSCEVIPTQTDESTSFDVWWNIFNGLHAVMGYRTEMWINDQITSPFGLSIGLGAPVISAWMNAIASDNSYGTGDTIYQDGNFNPNKWEPMGRASAVAVCGHVDDTANDVAPLERPTCLTELWFNN